MKFFERHKILSLFLLLFTFIFYAYFMRSVEKNPFIDKNSIHYVNDLYMSNELFYNTLSNTEKKLYSKVLNSIKEYKSSYHVHIVDDECYTLENCSMMASFVMEAVIMDHPELLQLANYSWSYNSKTDSKNVVLRFHYAVGIPVINQLGEMRIERIIDKIKKDTKDMNDIEKVKYVYEWIGNHNTYNRTFMYLESNQSAFTVFIRHHSVCAGFAKASQIIFQNIGIESYYVTGVSTGPHAFNIVKIDDKYYLYDSTVASSIKEESDFFYNGLNQKYMSSYEIDNIDLYPELDTEEIFVS